ncbi:hypothetical protein Pmani_028733 [Petrolisthes manimaculis]|uniref:t-SNARE coiled-coil homology domain-containing protein n=1 Tax=Petrolisthes manimaculis TaxID=1843537 RepID=A0AAE1P119_9EUCA|nr:hypothetical protein Pmani_028733 [Petrolisthes manimaculis]
MTARRRRAGSETYLDDTITTTTTTTPGDITTTTTTTPTLTSASQLTQGVVQWSTSLQQQQQQQAYYKKTDTVTPQQTTTTTLQQQQQQHLNWSSQQQQQQQQQPLQQQQQQQPYYNPQQPLQPSATTYTPTDWSGRQTYNPNHPNTNPIVDDGGDTMASRDRTQEYLRIVRSQHPSYNNNNNNGTLPQQQQQQQHGGKRPIRDLRQYKDFMQRSKLIGRNISSTYAKLEKLTHLAKKRSLFDDSHDREIQELTGIIRHDLTSLTKQLADLRNRSRVVVASNNNNNNNNNIAHLQRHSSNLVGSLQTKVALITQKFKDILEVRTENLKKQAERREQFTGGVVSGELPPGAVGGHHQGRADTMKTIESTIVELGQMFTQLATMVKEQEELVQSIGGNVEDAELNVEGAHSELLKYFKSVSSNRMLMVKVFGIMIVFFVIFVVFMA